MSILPVGVALPKPVSVLVHLRIFNSLPVGCALIAYQIGSYRAPT